MSYYDIDAILTDAQKVPCTFEITIPGLGYLEGNPNDDIKQGAKLELPLWLAEMLAVSRSSTTAGTNLTLDLPGALNTKVTNALKADARTVDLRALAPHFYALGARLLDLFEEDELADTLTESFRKRAGEIADMAYNSRNVGEGAEFLRGLDEEERQLFRMAHDGAKSVRIWMTELKKS